MEENLKIGFIGYGNMAQAMVKGLLAAGSVKQEQIFACAGSFAKLQKTTAATGIKAVETAQEVVTNSDFVILAVKPYMIEIVTKPVLELLQGKAVISIAAGYDFAAYEKLFKPHTHHLSTIPNTPVAVGEGIIVCEKQHSLTPEEFARFTQLFGKIALLEMVDTAQLSAAGTVSGCAPAFTAMYLEALADAGVKYGLDRAAAYRLAAKMICGTGKLYLENETHPGVMKDAVCSPGGTTIKGVAALEKAGFRGSVIEAIDVIEGE